MIYEVKLHVLSPVHIGCDESYKPTEFVIDTDNSTMIHFNLWQFIENLTDEELQELKRISEKLSATALVELYRFYASCKGKINGRVIPIPKKLAERYREVKQLREEGKILRNFNEFDIPRTFFNAYTQTPLIPGSSVKGSLRTGYLEGLLEESQNKTALIENANPRSPEQLEESILKGKMSTDPFRLLKISDFEPINEVKTKIIYQINVNKLRASVSALSIPLEVIPEGSIFRGNVSLDSPLENSGIREPLNFLNLLLKAHAHYAGIFNGEIDLRKNKGFRMPNISPFIDAIKRRYFLIRIGKHSGAEAVTIKSVRKIKIKTAKGSRWDRTATTIWLASTDKGPDNLSQTIPFGWVMLEVVNADKL
ncbi:type III-A CRISPR-associated RAMP protein Csm5 [Thermodesulfovibrio sp. 3907-1M]|uniref:CRISPR system Cms protein Csm5 n=1 Tax=Thermodesulfovibrio autotrophicus TaxID=3118333 RepID=A0AAU8GXY9_9BACT